MSRPLTWALGVVVVAAAGSSWTGHRLAGLFEPAGGAAQEHSPAPPAATADRIVSLNADLNGHYIVHPMVEGRRVRMMVDTGATLVALTHEDAMQAGVRPDRLRMKRIGTANGVIEAQGARIAEMRLGDILVRDVDAVVMPPGRLGTSLLGMSFLRGLRGFEMGAGRLVLKG